MNIFFAFIVSAIMTLFTFGMILLVMKFEIIGFLIAFFPFLFLSIVFKMWLKGEL